MGQLRAAFSANITEGCNPLAVSLRDESTGNPDRWLWDFGDGRTSSLQHPSLLYLISGSYTITLTVYRGNNLSNTLTRTAFINVYQYPVIDFTTDISEGCRPLPIRFTNTSRPGSGTIATTFWDFGDG
ncbi:MAG TPA: PKD domain-containing protein, partial [Phnomibacter sp.]|nr:PKD domain-containing protein [Phnomibacter sp.]